VVDAPDAGNQLHPKQHIGSNAFVNCLVLAANNSEIELGIRRYQRSVL
jgi:hypothetical protein